jgi:hypothetical protein
MKSDCNVTPRNLLTCNHSVFISAVNPAQHSLGLQHYCDIASARWGFLIMTISVPMACIKWHDVRPC